MDYATKDGYGDIHGGTSPPATGGEDYKITAGTLTFAPGETRKYLQVPVLDVVRLGPQRPPQRTPLVHPQFIVRARTHAPSSLG